MGDAPARAVLARDAAVHPGLVAESEEHGELGAKDSALLSGVLDFRDERARDVMCPRPDVAAVAIGATAAEVRATVRREQYSRCAVYRDTLDDVVGILLVKDLLLGNADPARDAVPALRKAAADEALPAGVERRIWLGTTPDAPRFAAAAPRPASRP